MRVTFLGSGAFAVPCLEALLDGGHDVAALVCQPDRERGRGLLVAAPPTKAVAAQRGLAVLQFRRVREPEAQQQLRALAPQLQVVVAFGQILPRSVIDIAPLGTINVHASLLPRWRGAAPIQWAIASGDTETGVTTMQIDEGLDTGPLLLARRTPVGPGETAGQLEPRLARLGAELLLETVDGLAGRTLLPQPQDPALATVARILEKEDGRIDWNRPAREIGWRVRGFQPWPGAFTTLNGRLLKVLRVQVGSEPGALPPAEPGSVLALSRDGVDVACGGGGHLRLLEVQPESRRGMPADAWATGARLQPGVRLG